MRAVVILAVVAACAPARPRWDHLRFGDAAELDTRSPCRSLSLVRDDAVAKSIGVPPEHDESAPGELARVTVPEIGTVVAIEGDAGGIALFVAEPVATAPQVVTYDPHQSVALVVDGDEIVVAYTDGATLYTARWRARAPTGITRPARAAVDHLPHCKPLPWITDAVVHDGLTYVAVRGKAMGEHGPCAGYTEANLDMSATIVVTRDGDATPPMIHPAKDQPARLRVEGGQVVGSQSPGLGFRVRCEPM